VAVRIETVGFYLKDNRLAEQQLQCIASATGGGYRRADSADALAEELSEISARAVREFTSGGQAVEGAPAAVDAPVLAPGIYSDTILAQETHRYAARPEQDQELTATVSRAGVTRGVRRPRPHRVRRPEDGLRYRPGPHHAPPMALARHWSPSPSAC
jgi:hypothetical protein